MIFEKRKKPFFNNKDNEIRREFLKYVIKVRIKLA